MIIWQRRFASGAVTTASGAVYVALSAFVKKHPNKRVTITITSEDSCEK